MTDARVSGIEERRRRVVVADDDADAREMLALVLEGAGFEVTQAADGNELLAILAAASPAFFDVVIADQRMPRMRGLDVLSQTSSRARFIVLSGDDPERLRAAAERLGAAILTKPVDVRTLIARIESVVAGGATRTA
jgi:DNA-binding response OmpR family regulator